VSTTTLNAAATAKQQQTIDDLATELGYTNVPEPTSARHASAIIRRLIEDRNAQGGHPAPTSAQIRLIEKLGTERGKAYKIPTTRKQASAKIAQLLGAATSSDQPDEIPAAA
jgi:hypothetical protein